MTKILLARHGEAAKGEHFLDPPLTKLGRRQAQDLAYKLSQKEKLKIISSPKLRAKQTAEPLALNWGSHIEIINCVTEIPTPKGIPSNQRPSWIRSLLNQEWSLNDSPQVEWRNRIFNYLLNINEDTIIYCHFMVINSIVAQLRENNRVQQFHPDYASITELKNDGTKLHLVQLGSEKRSHIL
ncbi:histidine phosphatase family protein [Microbulbifer sp. GL-2]|uniref:histidine phosphatase family protein n=1 Tax=Microbulbifer sp. GL-2 TaxID=2591606 RepID=UPI00116369F7|nr:histidine phosphatase family protein [Microbulbifer sp. GL-2]BBM02443.1 hypothetical protein GL2_25170 [Microbulbifer sp. GL-2]